MTQTMVEVTKADKDAASEVVRVVVNQVRRGRYDHSVSDEILARHRIAGEQVGEARATAAIVSWLLEQSDKGADIAIPLAKGSTKRAAFGGGSLALKKAADAIERNQNMEQAHD